MSRLVLVGRGGLRLHEEVFLTGVLLSGRGLAEEKVHDVLDRALDAEELAPAGDPVRTRLAQLWNAHDATVRSRLEAAVRDRAAKRQDAVGHRLEQRRSADLDRAARDLRRVRASTCATRSTRCATTTCCSCRSPTSRPASAAATSGAMEARLDTLTDERARELAGIRERYADVRPYVSTAAVVFAVTPQDATDWTGAR